ncbi:MAG: DNA mismatch repair protein MutS [SAR324 cluster bacterium]|uniref:DNA mismatch repair protein MutS n=1 Tax=SAR324 cluster bacterium TaxID=2024889 RepID=A0A2A4SQZ4_9DELT|nr:MAG: DNA mismatch repair protein MutS [SAR324 cluster bacterium]
MSTHKGKLTPMMQQFYQIKQQHPDTILFYRMGDFYEMFGEDAVIASKILQIQLTTRNKNKGNETPMCGIPLHAYEQYLNKLTSSGHKVAVCEQMEDPAQAKGLVRREVVRIITPGTVIASDLLDATRNSFLASIGWDLKKGELGIAFCDLTTGEFELDQLNIRHGMGELLELLYLYKPREILVPQSRGEKEQLFVQEFLEQAEHMLQVEGQGPHIEHLDAYHFEFHNSDRTLKEHFQVGSLAGFGVDSHPFGIQAAGALLNYLKETQKDALSHILSIKRIQKSDKMLLDESTVRNLELFEASSGSSKQNTLIHLLDATKTAMGARMLRRWMAAPLLQKTQIERRLDSVDAFLKKQDLATAMRDIFAKIGDLERIIARIAMPATSITDLVRLRESLEQVQKLPEFFQDFDGSCLYQLVDAFDPLQELCRSLQEQILPEPKTKLKDGGYINFGVNEHLDELKHLMKNGKQLIANLEAQEKEKTGISSLKIKFNRVFGYFIEVSNASKHLVPDHYVRKQTLVNNERYVTEELNELEESILSAADESIALELEIFTALKKDLQSQTGRVQKTAKVIAELDVLATFSFNALMLNYVRPELDGNPKRHVMEVKEGRHPVIESLNLDEPFIPNDIRLDSQGEFIQVITGPNMGGKSTFMRQKALIALMAQMGSFVPATQAKLPIFDRIFTRVGASDNLTRGQSTFMVEMSEAASILNNATSQSLIILDEIGRGTSTFDGISIAWAIVEHIHNLKALTLFATHYHELVLLEEQLPGVANAKVVIHEEDDNIVFLRKVVPGQADKSYGIQVARLAGLPLQVVQRAKGVLEKLEVAEQRFNSLESSTQLLRELPQEAAQEIQDPDPKPTIPTLDSALAPLPASDLEQGSEAKSDPDSVQEAPATPENGSERGNQQIDFFTVEQPWVNEIRGLDLMNTTPMQAMEFLNQLQRKI